MELYSSIEKIRRLSNIGKIGRTQIWISVKEKQNWANYVQIVMSIFYAVMLGLDWKAHCQVKSTFDHHVSFSR